MKKRTVITVVALALSAILSLSMIGCGKGTRFTDLRETTKQAAINYYENYNGYDNYGTIKINFSKSEFSETYAETTYKPSADAQVVTEPVIVMVKDEKITATLQVKPIDGVLNVKVEQTVVSKVTSYSVNPETSLLDKTETVNSQTTVHDFSKNEDSYYARKLVSDKAGDAEAVETKTYQVYTSESEYKYAVENILDDISESYTTDVLNVVGSAQLLAVTGLSPEVSKKRDAYTLSLGIDTFRIESNKPCDVYMGFDIKVSPTGVQEIKTESSQNVLETQNYKVSMSATIGYANDLTAPVNPFDGYQSGSISAYGIVPELDIGL